MEESYFSVVYLRGKPRPAIANVYLFTKLIQLLVTMLKIVGRTLWPEVRCFADEFFRICRFEMDGSMKNSNFLNANFLVSQNPKKMNMKARLQKKTRVILFAIFMMGMISPQVFGQTTSNEQQVLELAFSMAQMDSLHHLNSQNLPILVIVDNGVLTQGFNMTWFGNPVELRSAQDIATSNIAAYVVFDSAIISNNEAVVGFSYIKQGGSSITHYLVRFHKVGNIWIHTSNQQ